MSFLIPLLTGFISSFYASYKKKNLYKNIDITLFGGCGLFEIKFNRIDEIHR